jgi:hypothetical protein
MKVAVLIALCAVALSQVSAVPLKVRAPLKSHRITVTIPKVDGVKAGLKINCDALLDSLFEELQPEMVSDGLDPLSLYSDDILDFIIVSGELLGLSTIARSGECEMTVGTDASMTFGFGLDDLVADLVLDIDLFGWDAYEASAEADFATLTGSVVGSGSLPEGPFNVTYFNVDEISDCVITITGLGLIDYLADDIADLLCNWLDTTIIDLFDSTIQDLLNEMLQSLLGSSSSSKIQALAHQKIGNTYDGVVPSKRHH